MHYAGRLVCSGAGPCRNAGDCLHRVRDTVNSLLASVSEEDRILLTLKEVEGLSLKELEQIYHVSENSLKVRLFRARQRVLKTVKGVTRRTSKSISSGDGL